MRGEQLECVNWRDIRDRAVMTRMANGNDSEQEAEWRNRQGKRGDNGKGKRDGRGRDTDMG